MTNFHHHVLHLPSLLPQPLLMKGTHYRHPSADVHLLYLRHLLLLQEHLLAAPLLQHRQSFEQLSEYQFYMYEGQLCCCCSHDLRQKK